MRTQSKMDASKGLFATPERQEVASALVSLDFESARDQIRASEELSREPHFKSTLEAIDVYLSNEAPDGASVRKLSGMLGMGPDLASESQLLGDKAPKRIAAIRPVLQILYDDFIASGGTPYSEKEIARAQDEYERSKSQSNNARTSRSHGTVADSDDATPDDGADSDNDGNV